jgi:hypothetical protein
MGEPFCNDKKICGYDHFCAPNLPKNSIWTNFSTVLALFLAFFVLNTEFLHTPPPPHALHIWNAQDLYFHKKWVNRSTLTTKFVFLTTFVHQIYTKMLAIPAQWTTVQPPHFLFWVHYRL